MMRAHASGHAFTLVEFLVAMTLTLILLLASGTAIAGATRSLVEGRSQDSATSLAYAVLEKAQAYKCGTDTGVALDANCQALLAPGQTLTPPASSSVAGSSTFTFYADRNGVACDPTSEATSAAGSVNFCYQVLFRSASVNRPWLPATEDRPVQRQVVVCHERILDPGQVCSFAAADPAAMPGILISASEAVNET